MPVFEYRCLDCNNKFDVFHKTQNLETEIKCPKCNSENSKKLFSAFSASMESFSGGSESFSAPSYDAGCSSCGCGGGTCGID